MRLTEETVEVFIHALMKIENEDRDKSKEHRAKQIERLILKIYEEQNIKKDSE